MEPFITSSLSVAQKIPSRDVSGLITGVVVDAKVGPLGPTLITTPRQFLEVYTVNRTLSKGDHASLLNAFYLSRFTDLIVTRATNSVTIPLIPIGGSNGANGSVILPNGQYATQKESLVPHVHPSPGDYKSLFLQIDNVLFYGKDQMNPFASGDGVEIDGTATAEVKATTPEALELNGLGTIDDYITVELSVPLTTASGPEDSIIDINVDAFPEIVQHFAGGGVAAKPYLHVTLNPSATGFTILGDDSFEGSSWFLPVVDPDDNLDENVYNISYQATLTQLALAAPYLIGTTNVGVVDTYTVWFSDMTNYTRNTITYHKWVLNIVDPINGKQSYKVSDDPEAIDSQGNPIFYTWISEFRTDIVFVQVHDNVSPSATSPVPSAPNLGKSVDYINSISTPEKLVAAAGYALTAFEEYEDYRIQLYTDAGWYHPSIAKGFENIAKIKFGLTCIGIDPTMKDVNLIKAYAADYNSFYSIVHANAGKDTSVVGFQIPVSPSCYFIETIAKNSTRNAMYAPTFSKVNGTISESNLFYNYNKTQRDLLSKARVNVLMYDRNDGVAYINNNLLTDSSGSLIDEDQSIRIINDIQFDLESIMKNYYSLFNTAETRTSVEAAIDSYFTTVIMPQTYTISGFNVVCSEVNNTMTTIQNNELHVEVSIKLNHSIKYITILTKVVPTL